MCENWKKLKEGTGAPALTAAEETRRYDSPLGVITITGEGDALTGLRFDDRLLSAEGRDGQHKGKDLPVFAEAERWLDAYFGGRDPGFLPKMNLRGTSFRLTIWELLLTVPYGRTVTYGEIARRAAARLGVPRMSAQAVGGAAGHNPIVLMIPCHRVIGSDGSLTGYAGGQARKAALLELEAGRAAGTRKDPGAAASRFVVLDRRIY